MLSGGERGRVVLTEVLLKQANFLILDEPTNHLDISSKEVLEEALKSFEGTILFISHDRYFINKIATRVIEVQKDQCLSYNGNYDDYLAQKTPVVETTQKVVTEARQRQIIDKKTKNEIKKLGRIAACDEDDIDETDQHGGCNTHLYFGKPKRDDKEQHDRKERSKSLEKIGMLGKFRKRPDESFFVNGLLEAAFFVIAEDKTNRG